MNIKCKNNIETHYTLTFSIIFPYSYDECYLSFSYPFTYSCLQLYLNKIISSYYYKQLLCYTILGNNIDIITITNFNYNLVNSNFKKPYIIISSRVHPGESISSFICKGIIDFLLFENNSISKYLKNNFIFKIIPMLNPDGVIHGNHRCSLIGNDLNRQYQNFIFPHICNI